MHWDDNLSGVARRIAATDAVRLRVMAGPGTGKSFAMQRRVARLLGGGQDPKRMLAVTFTRNAAANLVQDLRSLGVQGCEQVRSGTLHSFCFSLLQSQRVLDYLQRVPRTVITFEKSGALQFEGGVMLDDLGSTGLHGDKRKRTKTVRAFEAAWSKLQSEDPGWPKDALDRQFEDELIGWLRFHNAMLIGEVIPESLRLLRNNPENAALTAFDHVIVDEYQDLNRAEQELIDVLASSGASAVVGDADQSIYRFRHANPEGIDTFHLRNSNTYDEALVECRRCPIRVVELAARLIGENHFRMGSRPLLKPFQANSAGEVHIVQWQVIEEEAQGIADYASYLVRERGYKPGDVLIMTPRRLLGYRIRDALVESQIPVHSFYQEESLESEPAQRVFTLLTILSNPDDRVAFRWWLGQGSSSSRAEAYQRLRLHCESTNESPRAVLEAIAEGIDTLHKVTPLVKKHQELLEAMAGLSALALPDLIDRVLPEGEQPLHSLRELALTGLKDCDSLEQLLGYIKTNVTHPEVQEGDFVRVMSLHKAKGLTSKVAIITDCNEGLIPFIPDSEGQDERNLTLQEQRRLFYVAITRCKEILVVSSVARMNQRTAKQIGAKLRGEGFWANAISSRFISELGPQAPKARKGADWAMSGYPP